MVCRLIHHDQVRRIGNTPGKQYLANLTRAGFQTLQ